MIRYHKNEDRSVFMNKTAASSALLAFCGAMPLTTLLWSWFYYDIAEFFGFWGTPVMLVSFPLLYLSCIVLSLILLWKQRKQKKLVKTVICLFCLVLSFLILFLPITRVGEELRFARNRSNFAKAAEAIAATYQNANREFSKTLPLPEQWKHLSRQQGKVTYHRTSDQVLIIFPITDVYMFTPTQYYLYAERPLPYGYGKENHCVVTKLDQCWYYVKSGGE